VQHHAQAMAAPATHVAGVADAAKLAQALHSGTVPHR
jgi:hypothetical protein